ncbi:MAG: sodium:solute symporter family transporter [Gemmatimonadota bacterium]
MIATQAATEADAAARGLTIVVVAVLYFAGVAVISIRGIRRTKNAADFFVAGRGIGLFTMTIAAMAATLSGFAFIGGPGLVYTLGIGALFINLPLAVTATMGATALATRLRLLADRREIVTIPDAIAARYNSTTAQGYAGLAIICAVTGYMATNLLALGIVLDSIFSIGLQWGVVAGTAITLAYSASGGILAGVYTDVFQGSIKVVASVIVFGYVLSVGGGMEGISEAIRSADASYLEPWGRMSPLAAMSFYFVFGLGTLGQPHVIHKYLMLRDPRQLRWYPIVMTIVMALTLLLFVGVGLVTRALVASGEMPALERPDDATPTFLLRYTPPLVSAIVFSGVVAAIMSTVNSFMNVGAAALVRDVPRALGRRFGDELLAGRVATVAISVVAAAIAMSSGTMVAFLGIFGWGLFASTIVPSLAIGLNWTGATRAGAIASIITGLAVTLVLESMAWFRVFTFPGGVTATAVALVASLLVFFTVSAATSRTAQGELSPDIRQVVEM